MSEAGKQGFDPPPDGARLVSLDDRRRWLGDVEIAQSLPRSGMVLLPEGAHWPQLVVSSPSALHVRATAEHGREVVLDVGVGEALARCWEAAWLWREEGLPEAGEAVLLLHSRGLFRWVSGTPAEEVEGVLAGVLRGRSG